MELTEGFRAAPGCCATCGTSKTGPVIDLQVADLGVYARTHRVYLCADCATYVGQLIGPAVGKAIVASDLRDDYLYVQQRLDYVERERDELQARIDAIRSSIHLVDP
jgi:hypothetical protein